jgi:hypothetical protein
MGVAMGAMEAMGMEALGDLEALDMVMDTAITLASELLRLMLNPIASMVATALETTLVSEAMALKVDLDMALEATALIIILERDQLMPSLTALGASLVVLDMASVVTDMALVATGMDLEALADNTDSDTDRLNLIF